MRIMDDIKVADSAAAIQRRSVWLPALCGFSLSIAAWLGIYWATAVTLVELWAKTGMFQYALLIFPISLWLIWNKRHELEMSYTPSPCLLAGIPLLLGAYFVWLLGSIASVSLLQDIAFIATFPILVLIFFGVRVVRALAFPLGYLVFAIPAGQSLVGHFQPITAWLSVQALQLTGVPVLLEGHFITTPWMVAHVADACSGIKFFLACTALGCLFGYLMFTSLWRRIAFVIVSLIVPILANGLRVYFTILIGGTFGVQYASGTDHLIFGWQFFGTVLFLLFLGGWFLRQPPPEPQAADRAAPVAHGFRRHVLAAFVGTLAVLIAAPVAAWALRPGDIMPAPVRLAAPELAGWSHPASAIAAWQPEFKHPNRFLKAQYASGVHRIGLYAAMYRGAPMNSHDVLAYGNTLFNAERWSGKSRTTHKLSAAGHDPFTVREIALRGTLGRRRLIWYWYSVNGKPLIDPVRVKGWQAWEQLTGSRLSSSVIAVSTKFRRGERASAEAALARFISTAYPALDRALKPRHSKK
jgi:exosortase A